MDRAGRYRLGEILGEGATGVVHRATTDDGAEVAVKLLRAQGAVARARFLREARLANGIESSHVVPILEVGDTYLVLPFFPGGSLAARIRRHGRLDLDETIALGSIGRAHV